jgi:hypothetical protein
MHSAVHHNPHHHHLLPNYPVYFWGSLCFQWRLYEVGDRWTPYAADNPGLCPLILSFGVLVRQQITSFAEETVITCETLEHVPPIHSGSPLELKQPQSHVVATLQSAEKNCNLFLLPTYEVFGRLESKDSMVEDIIWYALERPE